jgi:rubrerythrin
LFVQFDLIHINGLIWKGRRVDNRKHIVFVCQACGTTTADDSPSQYVVITNHVAAEHDGRMTENDDPAVGARGPAAAADDGKLKCPSCEKTFQREKALRAHVEIFHKAKEL